MIKKPIFIKSDKETDVKETKVQAPDVPHCECGQPVATELGQTSVCKKHIRTS